MTILSTPPPPPTPVAAVLTVADLIEQLGGIPPSRIWLKPPLGTATEQDVIDAERKENRLCELIDGVLVEKPMGYRESLVAALLVRVLGAFVAAKKLGLVSGADGMMRLFARRVRIPDVAFVSWARVPGGRVPDRPIPDLAPDLAVEVLSESNTRAEMEQKRREYFRVGTQRVWEVDLETRTVDVYTSPDSSTRLTTADVLEGEPALPGFRLPVAELFAVLDQQAPGTPPAP